LLAGIPLADTPIDAELTTPTGAAVAACLVNTFTKQPKITIEKVGIGAGTRELAEQPNILRLFWGLASESPSVETTKDVVWQLETNIDDVPAEILGYTAERLFELGALDVFSVPIQMKKNRPAVMVVVLCEDEKRSAIEQALFQETGTLGIRRCRMERSKLDRQLVQVPTIWGPIQGKVAWNDSMKVFTPEFEDCAKVARQEGVPLRSVFEAARRAFEQPS
jgi:pyridinium-3,5-bisthiocarboxylic acid mononucleotide nickel chelatase